MAPGWRSTPGWAPRWRGTCSAMPRCQRSQSSGTGRYRCIAPAPRTCRSSGCGSAGRTGDSRADRSGGRNPVHDLVGVLRLAGAVGAAVEAAAHLGPVPDDGAPTVLAPGRQACDRALEAVERVAVAGRDHLEGLVVVVAADLAFGHGHLRLVRTAWPVRYPPPTVSTQATASPAFRLCSPTDVRRRGSGLPSPTWS